MKTFHRLSGLFLAMSLVFGMLFAVAAAQPAQAATVKLNYTKTSIVVGNTKTLKVLNTKNTVTWSSGNKSVATVSSTGKVTALKTGTATISAKVSGKTYKCTVTVTKATLNYTKATVYMYSTKTLKFTNSSGKVTWSSSDKTVATVSTKGVVTPVKTGTATISAKIGSTTYKCTVTVKDVNASPTSVKCSVKGGGVLIPGESSEYIKFAMEKKCSKVTVYVLDEDNASVYSKSLTACAKGKTYTVTWTPKSTTPTGVYHVKIKAGTTVWTSEDASFDLVRQIFADGSGSSTNPFIIKTLAQFKKIGRYLSVYYKQAADIDGGGATITGFFADTARFDGIYDGAGYKISNLTVQNSTGDTAGLFNAIGASGEVKNVNLENITVSPNYWGGILAWENYGKIRNCTVTSCNADCTSKSYTGAGVAGIVCNNHEGATVSGCTVSGCTMFVHAATSYCGQPCDSAGLVVTNDGTVRGCTCENSTISTEYDPYGTRGNFRGSTLCVTNNGKMIECDSYDCTMIGSGHAGIVCSFNNGTITSCSASGYTTSVSMPEIYEQNGTVN